VRGYRLARAASISGADEWPLRIGRPIRIGRADSGVRPDVDLSPDRAVSRCHAELWFAEGDWWIQDVGSRHGTRVNTHSIPIRSPVRCSPGCELSLGNTSLTILSPDCHRLRGNGVVVDLHVASRLSYTLATSRLAPDVRGTAYSAAGHLITTTDVRLTLDRFVEVALSATGLSENGKRALTTTSYTLSMEALLMLDHQSPTWKVEIGGQRVDDGSLACAVLPYDEWSYLPEHWASLATFVQPGHPAVIRAARDACKGLVLDRGGGQMLEHVYSHFAEVWSLDYRKDPAAVQRASQRLRLTSDVLWNPQERRGEGTCLDLALLIAACLESLRLQPLIAVINMGRSWHALVGIWNSPGRRIDVLPIDTGELADTATWLDPNGCTSDPRYRAGFATAVARAQHDLNGQPRLFVLDIAAARAGGILPVPIVDRAELTRSSTGGVP